MKPSLAGAAETETTARAKRDGMSLVNCIVGLSCCMCSRGGFVEVFVRKEGNDWGPSLY